MRRKVKIVYKKRLKTYFVVYLVRMKHQRYTAAQFHESVASGWQYVEDWIAEQDGLEYTGETETID